MTDYTGKVIFVAGGSSGLGKSIAEILVTRGAHVTVFGRKVKVLEETKGQLLGLAPSTKQEINAVQLDLTDAEQVVKVFAEQPRLPDALYCVAGGCVSQLGFFTDLSTQQLEQCMQSNYLTSIYPAHALLRAWIEEDKTYAAAKGKGGPARIRDIVFISSAAALCNVPGYIAYAAPKCAQRAIADTLRQEAAIYSTSTSQYKMHVAFPNTFVTEAFIDEQKTKPELTKRIESSNKPLEKLDTAEYIANTIVKRVAKGDFAILSDFDTEVLWSNMLGSSPKRGLGVLDSVLGLLSGFFVWPVLRFTWTRMCRQAGKDTAAVKINGTK